MPILKLKPFCKDYLWGGNRLRKEYGIVSDKNPLAEAWVLSCHPDGPSVILNGPDAGKTLMQYINEHGKSCLGSFALLFEDFPVLIKLIDAKEALSVQVHPSNKYAMEHEGQYGKTEMWVVLDAEPGAFLYYGLQTPISPECFAASIADQSLLNYLKAVPVHKGDVFFIPSGTIHAIGKGILLAEIQQNSNVTYRIYDYQRLGPDGKLRPLHIEEAKAVAKLQPAKVDYCFGKHMARCQYFTVDQLEGPFRDLCDDESFTSLLVIDGEGRIFCGEEEMNIQKGDSLFLPAESGAYRVDGFCQILRTRVGTI